MNEVNVVNPTEALKTVSLDQHWDLETQISTLLKFVDAQNLDVAFSEFLNVESRTNMFENIDCNGKFLLAEALSQIAKDETLKLFKLPMATFAEEDSEQLNPINVVDVYLASTSPCAVVMPYHKRVNDEFSATYYIDGDAEEVSINDLLQQ
ncbi:hypothetical protein OTK49_21410 [Vibrio coralliirubri]|uniref:hypothetical protein n=1 Tax=Vibrio coralliirubri TaxID=1516159 RepID=UPI002284C4E3|nr:hypothetical protein [Vibrio coralliirubri]MCY9865080.1 hypothetical protein [Vibrio coralliirubri]